MNVDLPPLEVNEIEAKKEVHCELSKKDEKCLFLIHKYMDPNIVRRL